ncbi:DUF6207 family protein [Streptomyces sp. NPDC058770]|uniref:DUF6207 family protein n=1 Tax=Streptomyces sp. NPDC058770 TaxID=3346631 RepID=UPI0036B5F9C7
MKIDAQHIDEPGLVVLDIAAADEETAPAVVAGPEQWWAASGACCAFTASHRLWADSANSTQQPRVGLWPGWLVVVVVGDGDQLFGTGVRQGATGHVSGTCRSLQ